MAEPILSVSSVKKRFGGLLALNEISFDLQAGAIMGLMGPNGAGKTTLVNVICGFYKPDAGRVVFRGKDITGLPAHKICHLGIARTYQIPLPFGELTALQNVAVAGMYGRGLSRSAAEREALEVLALTDLSDKQDVLAKNMTTITKIMIAKLQADQIATMMKTRKTMMTTLAEDHRTEAALKRSTKRGRKES